MGILSLSLVEEGSKMKLIAACLVAAAFAEPEANAEADAALLYGAYGYGGHASPYALGYRGYAGYAGAYGAYPVARAYGAHYIGKRSADAEPEAKADAAILYGAYGYSAYVAPHAYGYTASPYAYGYSGYSGYAGYPYAAHGAYAYGAYPYLG